ncbi:hypothetical protein AHF37_00548 [Paragonimus kellicotti]|nr:hypothetical protein AHF37_00548 [Paragonimus kellicotti]
MFDLCGRVARRIASYYISFERAGTGKIMLFVESILLMPRTSMLLVYSSSVLPVALSRRRVGEDFVIVFTDERGTLEFVFCHWPNDQVILCLASGLPWFGCFHGLLDIIWRNDLHRDSRWHVLHPFLSRLMTTEPPPPSVDHVTCSDPFSISRRQNSAPFLLSFAKRIFLYCDHTTQLHTRTPMHIKFRIPTSNSPHNLKYVMEYYNALDTSLWIHIFVCLLLERSVLFHSRRLSRLTSCVLASVSLLYPIQWVNSFYPLIPKRVIEVLGYVAFVSFNVIFMVNRCPVPFVAGIHACNLEAAMEHVNPGTCLVDLDTGVIRMFEEKFVTPKSRGKYF